MRSETHQGVGKGGGAISKGFGYHASFHCRHLLLGALGHLGAHLGHVFWLPPGGEGSWNVYTLTSIRCCLSSAGGGAGGVNAPAALGARKFQAQEQALRQRGQGAGKSRARLVLTEEAKVGIWEGHYSD